MNFAIKLTSKNLDKKNYNFINLSITKNKQTIFSNWL